MAKQLAVLVSGRGSNLRAVLEAHARGEIAADISRVISNVADAPALGFAEKAGVKTSVVRHQDFKTREDFDTALVQQLSGTDIVLLAGFMRILTPVFCAAFPQTVNVHPSLLPAFPGAHAVRDALAHGAKITGVTVHFVEAALDAGPIIAQEALAILPDDDEDKLLQRVHAVEHRLVPATVAALCAGRVHRDGRRVWMRA